ncbi:MAG: hypothetical protein PVJ49_00480 [Acidobacteriota bacterium]
MFALVVVLSACGIASVVSAQNRGAGNSRSRLREELPAGSFTVGVEVLRFDDGATSSPIDVVLWYPARALGAPMAVADYVEQAGIDDGDDDRQTGAGDGQSSRSVAALTQLISGADTDASPEVFAEIAAEPTWATRGAPRDVSRVFPVVVWSARRDVVLYQFALSELIASHGFIVAAVQRSSSISAAPWETPQAERGQLLEHQVSDLAEGLSRLENEEAIDVERYAVLSWSYGGESAIRLRERDPRVAAIIGVSSNLFDGWVYEPDRRRVLEPSALDANVAILREARDPEATAMVRRGLAELTKEAFFFTFARADHGNFNAIEGLLPGVFDISAVQPWSRAGDAAVPTYRALSRLVLFHLRRWLMGDASRLDAQPWFAELAAAGVAEGYPGAPVGAH